MTIKDQIITLINECGGLAELKPDSLLIQEGLDSLDMIDLHFRIEDYFQITLPDNIDYKNLTINYLCDLVTKLQPVQRYSQPSY